LPDYFGIPEAHQGAQAIVGQVNTNNTGVVNEK